MTRLEGGAAALVSRQKAGATTANPITYTRKAGGTVDLTGKAWPGRYAFSRLPKAAGGGAVVWSDRDYLIPVADLAVGGTPFGPVRGDRIAETINGAVRTFEVLAPLDEPESRADQMVTFWRVHTKEQAVSAT